MNSFNLSINKKGEKVVWKVLDAETAEGQEALDLARCIKQFVLNAGRNAKFLSSQQKESLFIAEIATLREEGFSLS